VDDGGPRLARRRRILLAVAAGAALLAIGGLIGASFVKSPAQLAADTAAPPPTVTTATVSDRVLTASIAMRGLIYPSTQYDVYAAAPSGEPTYLSRLKIKTGSTVRGGELLAEIDGSPLFALLGAVPAWRDLAPGDRGPDVTELQKALMALGYDDGDSSGYFGSATEHAVAAYYRHLGFSAPACGCVPHGDVLFLPSLPATAISVTGAIGQQPGKPFLVLSTPKALTITGELPPAYASQVKTGLRVTISDEATGTTATGTVTKVGTPTLTVPIGTTVSIGGSGSGTAAGGGTGSNLFVPVTVAPTTPLPAVLNGENVLVTVETGQSSGAVLAVPVAAIVTTASGRSSVTVVSDGGIQRSVPVTVGMSAGGYVQVTGALEAGDAVVVGG
jgi:peptidoglycan hydrolase-like protein with peptidoglycan-binding domain